MSADESGLQAASTIAAETEQSKSFCVGAGRSREARGGYCIWSSSFKGGSKLFKLLLQYCYDLLFMATAGVRKPLQRFTINHSWAHNSHLLEQTRVWELIYTFKLSHCLILVICSQQRFFKIVYSVNAVMLLIFCVECQWTLIVVQPLKKKKSLQK